MQVSKSGYYHWKSKPVSRRSKQNNEILLVIIAIFKQSRQTYGSPRMHQALKSKGFSINIKRVTRLMQEHSIYAHYSPKHKKAKIARNNTGFADNILNRGFTSHMPNTKWVSDTTFIWTQQGWLYLAAIIDLYSRKIVGWSMDKRNNTNLVNQALKMAIKHKPKQQAVLLHSDQGSTYRADDYLKIFKENYITQSMSRKGNCHDNAVAESFFSTLKKELISQQTYQTRTDAISDIFEYIEVFYNRIRLHSYLNYKGHDNLSMYKNMLKYCYDNEKQVCNSFPHFREEI